MSKDKLKEKLIEFYKVVEELDQIIEEGQWWRNPENCLRFEKLMDDRNRLVEKINEMLKKEEENE